VEINSIIPRASKQSSSQLMKLKNVLQDTEHILQQYVIEQGPQLRPQDASGQSLRLAVLRLQENSRRNNRIKPTAPLLLFRERTTKDALLFQLITALQLCSVRIDDARFVVTGLRRYQQPKGRVVLAAGLGFAILCTTTFRRQQQQQRHVDNPNNDEMSSLVATVAKLGIAVGALTLSRQMGNSYWMISKIVESATALEEWNQRWRNVLLTQITNLDTRRGSLETEQIDRADQARMLVEYALNAPRTVRLLSMAADA
jgi:hypothetical protein